jgi:osmoprotectant transport system permease protein
MLASLAIVPLIALTALGLALPADLPTSIRAHVELAGTALVAGAAIALPLGIYAAYAGALRGLILGAAALGRTLPSLAVLAFMLPFLGVGFAPAIIALTLLAIPPITINTDLGLRGVPASALDAARGMGMSELQIFSRVRWPLALPSILDGIRIAAIEVIASATLATFIGAGGLGDIIVRGLQTNDSTLLYYGAASVALLALAVEAIGVALTLKARKASL